MKAGLKKVHSLCKKHLVYQVWGQFWVVALPGFKIQQFDAKTQHLEAKTQHFEAKSNILKLKCNILILKPSLLMLKSSNIKLKPSILKLKSSILKLQNPDFEAWMLQCRPDAAIFQK